MPDDRRALALGLHAAAVGIGWMPVLLAFLAIPALRNAGGSLPPWLVGGSVAVGLAFAVPLLWPVFVAIGWFEANLVEQIGRNDRAAGRAAQILIFQAAAYLILALATLALAWAYRNTEWGRQDKVRWSWLVPLILALAHVALSRFVRQPANHIASASTG